MHPLASPRVGGGFAGAGRNDVGTVLALEGCRTGGHRRMLQLRGNLARLALIILTRNLVRYRRSRSSCWQPLRGAFNALPQRSGPARPAGRARAGGRGCESAGRQGAARAAAGGALALGGALRGRLTTICVGPSGGCRRIRCLFGNWLIRWCRGQRWMSSRCGWTARLRRRPR